MIRCKDCKFYSPTGRGNCSSEHWKLGYGTIDDWDDSCVSVEDDEGWGFEVGPEFGCVHGAAKE